MAYDVVIIGGGPAGSTVGSMLKKYDPSLRVAIFEREMFPRDHVGESQLPAIGPILQEIGAWDKVEAANFPIKIGATYRWGKTRELWDFQFLRKESFVDEPRPAKFSGQRTMSAFQVDRSIYDDILLRHSEELGCFVREQCGVTKVVHENDHISALVLEDGTEVTAEYYVDASGHSGILRRAMGVEIESPSSLQNVAFWDYWQNAEWATEIGVGGTFVQVMSLGYGWIWFIPLGPTRTSVGLIVPAAYYKKSGMKPEELYSKAIKEDERISFLMRNAKSEDKFETTKDWSFVAERHAGKNWFLAGEAGGFADPILAAGLTITHVSAREAAFSILEMKRGKIPKEWLIDQYCIRQSSRIRNHIRFADFWYTSNGQFTDLKDFTSVLAKESGLELDADKAWQWIAQGGFIDEDLSFGAGVYSLETVKNMQKFLHDYKVENAFKGKNILNLNLKNAEPVSRAFYNEGKVIQVEGYSRNGRILPIFGIVPALIHILKTSNKMTDIMDQLYALQNTISGQVAKNNFLVTAIGALESMIRDEWIETDFDPSVFLVEFGDMTGGLSWSDDVTVGRVM